MEINTLNRYKTYLAKFSYYDWKILIFLWGIVFAIAPGDYYNNAIERSVELHRVLLQGIIFSKNFFSIFDILTIWVSLKLIKNFGLSFSSARFGEKLIWFFSVLSYIFLMINPNNNTNHPVLGMPLFSDVSHYSHLVFLTTIFFLKYDEPFLLLLRRFCKIVLITLIIWSVYLFVLWLLGEGNYGFFNVNSILTEDDSLFVLAFAQTIFLLLYFLKKKPYYLLAWGFLFVVQILSFRRSGLFVAVLSSVTLALFYLIEYIGFSKKLVLLIIVIIITMPIANAFFNNRASSSLQFYFNRFFGMFIDTPGPKAEIDSDSGHFEHSDLVFSEAFEKLGFWGIGYSERSGPIVYEAGIRGVHNAYVAMWLYRGIIGLSLVLVILFVFAERIINFLKNLNKFPPPLLLLKATVIIFFMYFLISIFYLSIHHLIDIREIVLRTLLISFLYKVTTENYKILIN